MSDESNGHKTLFGYPVRDWVILVSFFASIMVGGIYIGGTPNQTTTAIDDQTKQISEDLQRIQRSLDISSRLAQTNAVRISSIESQIDSMQKVMIEGLRNLDGYFRGRLDQLRPVPDK